MPLTARQRLALRLRLRYRGKRVYFTLLLPSIIALIIFALVLHSGWAVVPSIGPVQKSTGAGNLTKLQEFLIETNQTSAAQAIKPITPVNPLNFDYLVVGCMVLALGPYSIDVTRIERRQRRREADFVDFLFELSELVRGGIDPIKAVNTLASGSFGTITNEIQMVSKQMNIGYSFEEAMRNLGKTLKSPLADKYIDLVIQASYSGGSVANLVQRASADMGIFLSIEREKRAGLAQYTIILYTAQLVLIGLSAILVVQFLPDLASISSIGGTSLANSILGQADIGSVNLSGDLLWLCMINGFLGGLVIGKIAETRIKHGIKHGLILLVIAMLAWAFFVVPASTASTGPLYNYTILPHDTTGFPTLPLAHPVVVQVNFANGTAAGGVVVDFGIQGPPQAGGSVDPTSTPTADTGQATTQPIMGSVPGDYFITVTVAGNTTGFLVNVTSGGD